MTPTSDNAFEASTTTPATAATASQELNLNDPSLEGIKIAISSAANSSSTEHATSISTSHVDDLEAAALLLGLRYAFVDTVPSIPTMVSDAAFPTNTPYAAVVADTSAALEDFTLFPKLATELRAKIWFHALPGPRVIEIDYMHSAGKIWVCRKESQASPSSLLLANKESRQEFLRHYTPFLKIATEGIYDEATSRRMAANLLRDSVTYLCPAVDIIYICAPDEGEGSVSEESMAALCGIKCLQAVETLVCEYSEFERGYRNNLQFLNHLPGLKNIVFTIGDFGWMEFAGEHDDMKRPTGEIELVPVDPEDFDGVDQGYVLEYVTMAAKSAFQDPSKEEADCYPAYIIRGGVVMDHGDIDWL
ncbi:hypothetical protein DL95DRAFT_415079 [Leptodontidium sp. 2 PMI_412]|nr:hypothetical protein DL95DRAFT_415079 [Leptodontidium sp. 2 PMI_412]